MAGMDLDHAVHDMFAPAGQPGRVGAEVELIPVTDEALPRPVDPAVLVDAFDPAFTAAARPSFEPGGQLELSPPPSPDVATLMANLRHLLAGVADVAGQRGVRLEAVGTNPYHSCADVPLRSRTSRYLAMQNEFDQNGPDGRRMMRLTASLQIAVDLLPGAAGIEQWMVANLAGPVLTAVFANSTAVDGRPCALPGARTRIWRGMDRRRTGYDGRHLDPVDPIGAYLAFATAAPRLAIPASADPVYHLSTLFPPVRPRGGYLEIRYLDAQPLDRMAAAVTTVVTLLYDHQARRDALDLLRPRVADQDRAWREAASGYSPEADALMSIAQTARSVSRRTPSPAGVQ
jgi:glutamate--cysteine ligase